tara:strand:+ start:5323 stop:6657 length:1335 start_codon:yes stop_codon:yes gene_type:complete
VKEALKPYIEKLPDYLSTYGINVVNGVNGKCPIKNHKSAHPFLVAVNRNTGDYVWNCFACGEGGTIFELAASMHGYPRSNEPSFLDVTVRHLSDTLGIAFPDIKQEALTPDQVFKRDLYNATREVANHLSISPVKDYIKSRNWSDSVISKFNIGGISNYTKLLQYLRTKYSDKVLKTINFISRHSAVTSMFNDNRIIFTIHDPTGRPIGFTARSMNYKDGDPRKYINSSASPIFKKRDLLYNIHRAKSSFKRHNSKVLYMVEGQADVLSLYHHGIESVVGISGTAFTNEHIKLIQDFEYVVVCLDADDGGDKATRKTYKKYKEVTGKDLRLLQLPKGQDPDDFIMNNGVKAFLDLQSMLPEEWEIMNEHVLTKRLLADYWLPKIANMNSLHHSTLLTTLSNKSGIDLSSLRQNLNLLILDKISSLVANVALEDKVTLKIERSSI